MSGFDNEVIYAENVDFSGASPVQARVTQDGELLIGSSVSPNIRVNTLSSSNATVTITNGQGTIDLVAAGSLPTTFNGNTGSATPAANILNIVGIQETNTIASGNTVSILSPRSSEFIVDPVSNVGTHTSITTAMASASLGDTDVGTALTERFDQNSNFTAGASGGAVFTAPITGKYQFNFFVLLQQLDGLTHTPELKILTTAENYTYGNFAVVPAGNFAMSLSVLTDMTATDTAKFALAVSSGLKAVDVFGNATTPRTVVSGYLVC